MKQIEVGEQLHISFLLLELGIELRMRIEFFEDGILTTIFSLKFIGTLLFFVMILMLMVGGYYCPSINEERSEFVERLKGQHELEVSLGERNDTFVEPMPEGAWETACYYQEQSLAQVAIAVLVIAVLR